MLVSNLAFDVRSSHQKRELAQRIANCSVLTARRKFLLQHRAPHVWVGTDRFGLSLGVGWVNAATRQEAERIVELLNGTEVAGRAICARVDEPEVNEPDSRLLQRWQPRWLASTRAADESEAPPVDAADPAAVSYTHLTLPTKA